MTTTSATVRITRHYYIVSSSVHGLGFVWLDNDCDCVREVGDINDCVSYESKESAQLEIADILAKSPAGTVLSIIGIDEVTE